MENPTSPLLAEIEATAARLGLSSWGYARHRLRRGSLIARLKAGGGVEPATEALIRETMRADLASPSKGTAPVERTPSQDGYAEEPV